VIHSDIPENDMSQLLPRHGMKSKGLRPAFAVFWIFWAQLSSARWSSAWRSIAATSSLTFAVQAGANPNL